MEGRRTPVRNVHLNLYVLTKCKPSRLEAAFIIGSRCIHPVHFRYVLSMLAISGILTSLNNFNGRLLTSVELNVRVRADLRDYANYAVSQANFRPSRLFLSQGVQGNCFRWKVSRIGYLSVHQASFRFTLYHHMRERPSRRIRAIRVREDDRHALLIRRKFTHALFGTRYVRVSVFRVFRYVPDRDSSRHGINPTHLSAHRIFHVLVVVRFLVSNPIVPITAAHERARLVHPRFLRRPAQAIINGMPTPIDGQAIRALPCNVL